MPSNRLSDWRCRPALVMTWTGPNTLSIVDPEAPGPKKLVVAANQVEKKGAQRGTITHRDCNFVALSLDIAIKAAERGLQAFNSIDFHEDSTTTPKRIDRSIAHTTDDLFLEYAEQFMVAVTFSFHAVETFANDVIGANVTEQEPFDVGTEETPKRLNAVGLQAFYSTSEKVGIALPRLLGISPMPKSAKEGQDWDRFRKLEKLREEIIHLKWHRQYRSGDIDNATLWFTFINSDIWQQPRSAAVVLHYFARSLVPQPHWLPHIVKTFDLGAM